MINGEPKRKVYITGASGRLGKAVLRLVPDAVPIVRRSAGLENEIVSDFSIPGLKTLLQDAKTIIHLAGSMAFSDKKSLWESNAGLTKRIVEAAPPACRIILASSISVFGKKLAQVPADENTRCSPDSEYAKSKLAAEQTVQAHTDHVILRIGTMYGPGFADYLMVLRKIEEGKMMVIGDGKNRIPFVHVDDVAAAVANSLERGSGTYVLAGEPETQEKIFSIAAEALGVEPPKKHISYTISYWFAALRNMLGKTGFTTEHISILGSDRAFDCSRAREELGFSPRPLEQGIREMAALLKAL